MINYNEIESGVRAVVADINKNGIKTMMSCHGHKGHSNICGVVNGKYIEERDRGWISFDRKTFNMAKVETILKRNGLKRLKFFTLPDHKGVVFISFTLTR